MRIVSSDGKRIVDIGCSDIWNSIYATAVVAFGLGKHKVSKALKFMKDGNCSGEEGYEIAKQFNLIRDKFAGIDPDKVVYDIKDKKKPAPWKGKISPVVTSCANLYTTADGKDLLFEVVSILTYAQIAKVTVKIE